MKTGAASAVTRGHGAFAPDGDQRDRMTTWPKRPAVNAADDDGKYKKGCMDEVVRIGAVNVPSRHDLIKSFGPSRNLLETWLGIVALGGS
eukprot:3608666-Heterocapsa_arctica.AAC.1